MMRVCVRAAGTCERPAERRGGVRDGVWERMADTCTCEDTISVSIAARIAQNLNVAVKTSEGSSET